MRSDRKLSKKLQMESKLTLDGAVTQVRQSEAVKKQQGKKYQTAGEHCHWSSKGHKHPHHRGSVPRQGKTTRSGNP